MSVEVAASEAEARRVAMRVLVVGSGAREHALVWKLAQSPRVGQIFAAPGNPGTATLAQNVLIPASDLDGIVGLAKRERIDLAVVGPEEPLVRGLADRLRAAGVAACGGSAAASRIEGSKSWAKALMREASVPTARSLTVRTLREAKVALAEFGMPVVVKADGLAAGKGVIIAPTPDEALAAMAEFLEEGTLGEAGRTVVLEECLTGREVSVLALTDGTHVRLLTPACDYKRAFDEDLGPNTGGMGAYAPVPAVDGALLETIRAAIIEPTVRALAARGAPLQGVLYAGLMLTADGPKVLEFNARFGDPEAQVILPLLEADLAELLAAVATGSLADVPPMAPARGAAVGVVLASGGYPGAYANGVAISGLDRVPEDVLVFHAGTRRDDAGRVVTAGGRVLTVVGRGPNLRAARDRAYAGAAAISFEGRQMRGDIALRGTDAA